MSLQEQDHRSELLERIEKASTALLEEVTVPGLLQRLADTAREIMGAGFSLSTYEAQDGNFLYRTSSNPEKGDLLPLETMLALSKKMDCEVEKTALFRMILDEQGRPCADLHPLEDNPGLSKVFGARLMGPGRRIKGVVMIWDKEPTELTMNDEFVLQHLAFQTSACLKHFESRRTAEHRINELEAIFYAITDGVIVYDSTGTVVRANPAAVWSYGFNPVGKHYTEVFSRIDLRRPDGRTPDLDDLPLIQALHGITTVNEHLTLTSIRGRSLSILVSASPMLAGNQMIGAVVVWHDVTERDKIFAELAAQKEALRKAHDELEVRVRERTDELARANTRLHMEITEHKHVREKLNRYTLKLEQSNRNLQDFAFVASHDLQEPLRKIQTFGDLIKTRHTDCLNGEAADYLDRMQNAAKRMRTLIQALLHYSRLNTRPEEFTQVNLYTLAKEIVNDLEVLIRQTNGRVEIGDLATIEADANQMRQLFQNLIGNALKFHRGEGALVKIHGHFLENLSELPASLPRADRWYRILVEDNGIGFEEKYVDRIFAPFQRLHGRSHYEGTGMGLAICQKIVERHGGRITARSSLETGSTFIITLPVKQSSRH